MRIDVARSQKKRMKGRLRLLASRVKILESENESLRVAIALTGPKVESQGITKRIWRGKTVDFLEGYASFPLPEGWNLDTSGWGWEPRSFSRNGQRYVRIKVVEEVKNG